MSSQGHMKVNAWERGEHEMKSMVAAGAWDPRRLQEQKRRVS